MIEAVISSSVLIAIIILIRIVFKGKIKSSVRYFLWLIAAVRLMIPFELVQSPVSVMNAAEQILPQPQVTIASADTHVSDEAEPYLPDEIGNFNEMNNDAVSDTGEEKNFTFQSAFDSIRIFITAVMLLWFAAVNVQYSYSLRKNRNEFEYDAPIRVFTVPELATPCIFGLFSPAIYIPENAAEDREAVEYIAAHELCHYYHGDLIWTVLRYILLSVYWFDPFVWAAAVLSKRDCECACDEAAIKILGEEKRFKYGKAIIDLISLKRSENFGVASTSMASSKYVLKERMLFIASKPANRIYALIFSTASVLLAAGVTFTSAQEMPAAEISVADIPAISEESLDGRLIVSVTDRNSQRQEMIYFPAPDGYEPYIYMSEYRTAEFDDLYSDEKFAGFLDGSYFSAADVLFCEKSFNVNKWRDSAAFGELSEILRQCELSYADDFSSAQLIADISFYRANGGFSSKLIVGIYEDNGKRTALITGDDMNRLTGFVIDGSVPTEEQLRQAYSGSVHFEASADGERLYDLIYELSGQKQIDEINDLSYPPFPADSFSENISKKFIVTGEVPRGYVQYEFGDIVFAVPYEGNVNEIGSTFLWQNGSGNFRISEGKVSVSDTAEEIRGTFCGNECSLYMSNNSAVLLFSDEDGNEYSVSAGFADETEKLTAMKILGSIHME